MSPPTIELTVEPYQSGCAWMRFSAAVTAIIRSEAVSAWPGGGNHQPSSTDRLAASAVSRETVSVQLLEPPEVVYEPEPFPLEVVFEDAWMLAVNKPPGIIAPHGNMQSGTLCHYVQDYLDQQTVVPGLLRPGIVHRLDRETSGVILIAKTHLAHRNLVDAFEHSRVAKTYLALVKGALQADSGTIDFPIGQARKGAKVLMSARGDALDPKPARTNWQVLRRLPGFTLVAAKPVTGRNHQIRVHFAAIGHPLAGDEFYAAQGEFLPATRDSLEAGRRLSDIRCTGTGLARHALHAAQIEVAHPITGVWLRIQAGPPADLLSAICRLVAAKP
ncbi:MAG: RluA family pseudouridine synthase [Planctomycetaceae bacterium]